MGCRRGSRHPVRRFSDEFATMQQLSSLSAPGSDRTELAAVPDLPGVEVMRVDAPARLWRWDHGTDFVSIPLLPMRAGGGERNQLPRSEATPAAFRWAAGAHAE